jgi:hypothetical protein
MIHQGHNARLPLAALLIAATLLTTACGEVAPETLFVAYGTTQNRIAVRYAKVATPGQWSDAKFPASISPGRGIAMSNGAEGLMQILFTDNFVPLGPANPSKIRMVWGLGAEVWDSNAESESTAPTASGPSAARAGTNLYMVAFLRSGGTVYVGLYDHGTRNFIADFAPPGCPNCDAVGRPSVHVRGTTAIVAWRKKNGDLFDLVTARGTIANKTLTFGTPTIVPLPVEQGLQFGVKGDPVLARAGTDLYLAVVREQAGGQAGTLHGWQEVVMRSTDDGRTWTTMSWDTPVATTSTATLGFAGTSAGGLLLIALEQGTARANVTAARFANGAWQTLPAAELGAIFNVDALSKDFVVANNKH